MKLEVVNGVVFAHIDEYTYKEYFTFNGVNEHVMSIIYRHFNVVRVTDNTVVFESKTSSLPIHVIHTLDRIMKDVTIAASEDYDDWGTPSGIYRLIVSGTVLV